MPTAEAPRSWVVYKTTAPNGAVLGNSVCERWEWDAIEAAQPGFYTLLHSGIETEQEADKLARGTAGDNYVPRWTRKRK